MKYWVFQNNQVVGPFDREAIGQVVGFSSETLVCPEGRKGTQMGDWQRAGVVPEMAEALLAATRTPALARAGIERGPASMLPPEPTLRDLAVLGSLQERVSSLETLTNKLNDELRARDTEIARLKVELDQKGRSAADLQTKLADVEVRTYGIDGLKEELERSKAEARASAGKLEEHQRALEALQERVARGPTPEPSAIPNMSQPAFPVYPSAGAPLAEPPGMAPGVVQPLGGLGGPPMAGPAARPMGASKPGGMGRLGEFSPPAADPFSSLPELAGSSATPPEALPPDPFALPASSLPPGEAGPEPLVSLGAPPSPFGGPDPGLGGPPAGNLGAAMAAAPPPLVSVGDMPAPAKPRDKRIFFIIGLMALGVVVGAVLLGGKKKKKKPVKAAPVLTTPAGAPESAPVPAGEPATDLTQAAVDFVKGYQIPGRQETVAQLLESRYPTTGRLSPWMVEKLDNDKYQVNFWATQSEAAAGPKPVFQFQVRVRSRLLQGLNPPAMSLLNDGSLPAPEAPKASRRSRASARPAPAASGGDVLIGGGAPPPPPRRRGRKAPGSGVDAAAAVLEGLRAGTKAAEPPKAKAKAKSKAPPSEDAVSEETQLPPEEPEEGGKADSKTAEDEMLDQLLLPGLEKKTPVKKR